MTVNKNGIEILAPKLGYTAKQRRKIEVSAWSKCLVCANLRSVCLLSRKSCGFYKNNGNPVEDTPSHILKRLRRRVMSMENPPPCTPVIRQETHVVGPEPLTEYQKRLRAMIKATFKFYCYPRDMDNCVQSCGKNCPECPAT